MTEQRKLMIHCYEDGRFWNKEKGWVEYSIEATQFTEQEAQGYRLPSTKSAWYDYRDDLKYYDGDVYKPIVDDLELLNYTKKFWQEDGELEIEIPEGTVDRADCISRGAETGAYVRAWVWVPWDTILLDPVRVH